MARAGTLTFEDFKLHGQLGSRAIRVLIRLQELISARGAYNYLEIGSFMGRSLQPHVQDADCKRAVSIDLRPDVTPDERGSLDDYKGISAQDMIEGLAEYCTPEELAKLETITDTSDVLRDFEPEQFDLAFIDAEHTNVAAFRDFLNVLRVIRKDGVICFDDSSLVYSGLRNALAVLEDRGIPHAVGYGQGEVTIVALGESAQDFIDGFDPSLFIPAMRVKRRSILRMREAALRESSFEMMTGNRFVRRRLIMALRKDGWDVSRAQLDATKDEVV